ncbi:hypothetical protein K7432_015444 [Basidiobolus ranarum]|uniref:Cyclin-like domain-containing protein n=1 Tax=Basidiobolus ranarum TaxID=34480 RepID=A0ABR2VN28_9FUNG
MMLCLALAPTKLPVRQPIPESLIEFTIKRIRSTITCEDTNVANHPRSFSPSLSKLVRRVIRQCSVGISTLLIALIYVDRLQTHLPVQAVGTPTTGHRIFLASILIASKFHDDSSLWCVDVANLVGRYWDLVEITEMERVFLDYVKFDLWVDRKQLTNYVKNENIELDINSLYL